MAVIGTLVVFSGIAFVIFMLGLHNVLISNEENGCEMTYMIEYPQFVRVPLPSDILRRYPRYGLYAYSEGHTTWQLRQMKFTGIPVLFIPGNIGSHKQVRSLASVSLWKTYSSHTPFHFDYFSVDLNEEYSALFGGVLKEQRDFVHQCLHSILALYRNNENKPTSVILIGHSMGGMVAKGLFLDPSFDRNLVHVIITLVTPHKSPVLALDSFLAKYYDNVNAYWRTNRRAGGEGNLSHVTFASIGGGHRDIQVRSGLTEMEQADVDIVSTAVPTVWLSTDHLCSVWCKELVFVIVRTLFDIVNLTTKQVSANVQERNSVFRYHMLQRTAGKRFSTSFHPHTVYFDYNAVWKESIQRQFIFREPNGVITDTHIMIRLLDDVKHEMLAVEAISVDDRDWVFACVADMVHSDVRMCHSGINLSNETKFLPSRKFQRKFVYLNLAALKRRSFTHVILRVKPTRRMVQLNVDVHSSSSRRITASLPKWVSFLSNSTVLNSTVDHALYYELNLPGFEQTWQAYLLYIQPEDCQKTPHHAVVTMVVPWRREDVHVPITLPSDNPEILTIQYLRRVFPVLFYQQRASTTKQADIRDVFKKASKSTLTVVVSSDTWSPASSTSSTVKTPENIEEDPHDPEQVDEGDIPLELGLAAQSKYRSSNKESIQKPLRLRLQSPKPSFYNSSNAVKVTLVLDPQCKYSVRIQTGVLDSLGQLTRFYSPMLLPYLVAILLLTLREQLRTLVETGQCVMFHTALSAGAKPYYVLPAVRIGARVLGWSVLMKFMHPLLPLPDLAILQEQNLDFLLLPFYLYIVAYGAAYLLGLGVWLAVIFSGHTAHKIALRFLARSLTGTLTVSEWTMTGLSKLPAAVAAFLIALVYSTCGALSLCVGAAFFFLKICKMYEEYLEVLFKYSLKLLLRRKKKREASEEQQTASEEQQTAAEEQQTASEEQQRAPEEQQRAPEEQQSSANKAGDVNKKVAATLTENDAVNSKSQDNTDSETEMQRVAVPNPDAEDKTDTCQAVENTVSGAKIDEGSDKSLPHVEVVSESSDNEYSLSELHFNFTTLLLWLSVTLINVPSVLFWAHNYRYNVKLEPDPSFETSLVLCLCVGILWQGKFPKPNLKYYRLVRHLLYVLAVLTLTYAPLSLHRLGPIIATAFVLIMLHQVVAPAQEGNLSREN